MSDFKYIIMCGGKYCRWQTPRQFTEINGEKIISRTIRLLRDEGIKDIAISATDERFKAFGVPVLEHNNDFDITPDGTKGYWVSAFYQTEEPACYLMGDVVFSPHAIQTIILKQTKEIEFFASSPPFHPSYIKQWAEPFGFKVYNQKRFREAINFIKANINSGLFVRHPIAWELWQVINNENARMINYDNYTAINDYTCDVDRPGDAELIERAINDD